MTTIKEKEINGWDVTVYSPNDVLMEPELRKVILKRKYKNIRFAHADINKVLAEYVYKVAYDSLRQMAHGTYASKTSVICQSIKITKCKIVVKTVVTTDTKIE